MKLKEISPQDYSGQDSNESANIASRKRILVVDEEDPLREALVAMLTRYGHRVDSASEGTAAYEKFLAKPHDLIITDFRTRMTNGVTLAEKIKRVRPETRVILLIGWDEEAFSDGHYADSLLTKPVTIKSLLETVYELFPDSD
jgi:DNA-binding NtrC family response regulator